MNHVFEEKVKEVVDLFCENASVLNTAKVAGLSTVKVRKILITEHLWKSDTSVTVGELLKQGLTTCEIAEELCMSVKNVQAYMPYDRGIYGGSRPSAEAVRSGKYRKRMKRAAAMQAVKRISEEDNLETADERRNEVKKMMEAGKASVLKLHLELDMEYVGEDDRKILKKYGSMKKSISRDILAPADMTLHALHFAILRMFGWQNEHLHCYKLPENVFRRLTGNRFMTWAEMAGIYFRFPTDDLEDWYWDDDYIEGQSVKTWMRKKYTGPYTYGGKQEHYIFSQAEVRDMILRYGKTAAHNFIPGDRLEAAGLKEASVYEVVNALADFIPDELIERLPLSEVMYASGGKRPNMAAVREYIGHKTYAVYIDGDASSYMNGGIEEEREYPDRYDIPAMPVTDVLRYYYDYGDGWEVMIRCEDAFSRNDEAVWENMRGEDIDVSADDLDEVVNTYRPVCIDKDGIELVDDIGGIHGFCEMLGILYGADDTYGKGFMDREDMIEWADMMGWTGRRVSIKRTL